MVQRKKFDVILRLLVDSRYRRTKPPKPDASQFVVPARLPKPVIGSGGLSSSRFDDDVPEVNCTWTASFSWRVKEAALWFDSHCSKNLTGGPGGTWSSQSTSTDWLTRTHHWSSPRSKLAYKKPTSTRKLRKFAVTFGQGSKHHDWTASRWRARWRSQSSSWQHHVITWRGLIPADHEYLDSVAWPCHDCEVAPVWHHDVTNGLTCQFSAVCLTVFPFISELMILECSFPLKHEFEQSVFLRTPLEAILVIFGCRALDIFFLFENSCKNMNNDTTFVLLRGGDHLGDAKMSIKGPLLRRI